MDNLLIVEVPCRYFVVDTPLFSDVDSSIIGTNKRSNSITHSALSTSTGLLCFSWWFDDLCVFRSLLIYPIISRDLKLCKGTWYRCGGPRGYPYSQRYGYLYVGFCVLDRLPFLMWLGTNRQRLHVFYISVVTVRWGPATKFFGTPIQVTPSVVTAILLYYDEIDRPRTARATPKCATLVSCDKRPEEYPERR